MQALDGHGNRSLANGSSDSARQVQRFSLVKAVHAAIFHSSNHQGHVVFLRTVLAEDQDFVQDGFDDLRRCAVTADPQ